MGKLENYNGSVQLMAGITQKGGGDFALVEANAVQTKEDGTRLDETLSQALYFTPQELTEEQKLQVRQNIGAGSVGFSGSYLDLMDKPSFEAGTGVNSNIQTRVEGVDLNYAYSSDSLAMGKGSIANADRAVAIGRSNKAGGNASFVIGQLNTAYNSADVWDRAITDEEETGSANGSFVGGRANELRGSYEFMFGYENKEYKGGHSSVILGRSNKINAQQSYTGANLGGSTIIGTANVLNKGSGNIVLGYSNEIGNYDVTTDTFPEEDIISGTILIGTDLKNTTTNNKVVIGRLNTDSPNNIFELGIGTSELARKNAIEISNDNKLTFRNLNLTSDPGTGFTINMYQNGNGTIYIKGKSNNLAVSNSGSIGVVGTNVDIYGGTSGINLRTHNHTALKVNVGPNGSVVVHENNPLIANGKCKAKLAPSDADDVTRKGDFEIIKQSITKKKYVKITDTTLGEDVIYDIYFTLGGTMYTNNTQTGYEYTSPFAMFYNENSLSDKFHFYVHSDKDGNATVNDESFKLIDKTNTVKTSSRFDNIVFPGGYKGYITIKVELEIKNDAISIKSYEIHATVTNASTSPYETYALSVTDRKDYLTKTYSIDIPNTYSIETNNNIGFVVITDEKYPGGYSLFFENDSYIGKKTVNGQEKNVVKFHLVDKKLTCEWLDDTYPCNTHKVLVCSAF